LKSGKYVKVTPKFINVWGEENNKERAKHGISGHNVRHATPKGSVHTLFRPIDEVTYSYYATYSPNNVFRLGAITQISL
jgi:hypothetical protein